MLYFDSTICKVVLRQFIRYLHRLLLCTWVCPQYFGVQMKFPTRWISLLQVLIFILIVVVAISSFIFRGWVIDDKREFYWTCTMVFYSYIFCEMIKKQNNLNVFEEVVLCKSMQVNNAEWKANVTQTILSTLQLYYHSNFGRNFVCHICSCT